MDRLRFSLLRQYRHFISSSLTIASVKVNLNNKSRLHNKSENQSCDSVQRFFEFTLAQRLIRRLTELDDCETATAALTDKKKRSRKQTERRKFRRRRRRRRRPLVWNNKTIETLLSVRRGSISMSSTRARMNCTRANNIANSLSLSLSLSLSSSYTLSLFLKHSQISPSLSLSLSYPPPTAFRFPSFLSPQQTQTHFFCIRRITLAAFLYNQK